LRCPGLISGATIFRHDTGDRAAHAAIDVVSDRPPGRDAIGVNVLAAIALAKWNECRALGRRVAADLVMERRAGPTSRSPRFNALTGEGPAILAMPADIGAFGLVRDPPGCVATCWVT
jgi:hypothetical protein